MLWLASAIPSLMVNLYEDAIKSRLSLGIRIWPVLLFSLICIRDGQVVTFSSPSQVKLFKTSFESSQVKSITSKQKVQVISSQVYV